jgi:hypothetical protein
MMMPVKTTTGDSSMTDSGETTGMSLMEGKEEQQEGNSTGMTKTLTGGVNWPTPKESMMETTRGDSGGGSGGGSRAETLSPHSTNTRVNVPKTLATAKDKASYPIFRRYGKGTNKKNPGVSSKSVAPPNSNKLVTMAWAPTAMAAGNLEGHSLATNNSTAMATRADTTGDRVQGSDSNLTSTAGNIENNSTEKTNNSSTMMPAPVVQGATDTATASGPDNSTTMVLINTNAPAGGDNTNEGSMDLNYFGPNSNNSITMVPAPVDNSTATRIGPTTAVVTSASNGEAIIVPQMMQDISTNESTKDPNMALAPAVHRVTDTAMVMGPTAAEAAEAAEDGWNNVPAMVMGPTDVEVTAAESVTEDKVNSNNLRTMAPLPAPVAGMKAQEDAKSGKEDWHKVKPSKKKHKVKPRKKEQKKLTFKKTSREASKSGPMEADPQGIDSGTGGGNRHTKTVTMVTPPQEATKKRKSLEDDKEEGQEEGAVGMEVEEEKTMERGTPKQPPKSVKQTSEKFISIRPTKAMSQWYLACISNKIVQGLDRDVNLTEEDLKPGSEFYGRFQWACDYSTRDKVGDDKKTVLRDPNHWFQTLTKVPNGDDLRKSEDPAKRKAARNVLEVGINLARSPMELFKDQFVCDNRKFGLDPSEETAELVAARAAAYKFFGPVYQYKADLKSNGEVGVPVKVLRKVNAPKNSRRVDLAVNPDEAVTAAKRKALEDAEAAQEEDPPAIQYLSLTLPPSGTPPTPFWKEDMSEEEKLDFDEKQALCLDVAGRQLKEIVLGIFAKDPKAEILPHTHKLNGDPYPSAAESITADNLDSRFPMNIWQLRRYLSRASPRGGDAEIQGDMDISTVLTVPQIQEAVKLAANRNKDLLNGVKMKANECGSSRLQCVGWLQFASTRYENKKELTENLGSILFNGEKVTEFRLQNGSPPKGIREELDLNSREDFLASKVIEVFTSDEHASNVVQFFQWAFPLQGSADPTLHRDYRFILSSTCTYSSIGTANSPESKEMNIKAWVEHMQYTRDSACIDCIDNVRALDAQISEGVDMTIGEFMMRLVDRAQDKVPLIRLVSHQARLDPRTKRLRINVVCHRDNVEKVQIIIAFLFLVLQAQYPKLNVDGPFYPEKVTALKSTYILGDDSAYTNSVTQMRLDPKTHPIYRARSKAHMSLRIKGCTMFDRQAQDPSDVTVTSSKAPTIHTQEGDKDSSEEEDDEERHDMEVDSTATKKSDDQATFRSLGTGEQSSAGSADAEAAMGQMSIDNVPTEIQHEAAAEWG